MPSSPRPSADAARTSWSRFEPALYAVVAGLTTLFVARLFYASLRLQTLHDVYWSDPPAFDASPPAPELGPWSAPLDDVFIHFDFARSAARGFPFQWVAGNGYSSGGTSLLYPLLLAPGYWLGFRDLRLMEWAAWIACVSTFACLLAARRLAVALPRPLTYLLPFGFLCIGALDWSLFSGMEVAVLLGFWGLAYVAYDELSRCPIDQRAPWTGIGALALANTLLVGTRPESVVVVGLFALLLFWQRRTRGFWKAGAVAALTCLPAALLIVAQSLANRLLTGESSAAGALVKLEVHHPYLSRSEVLGAWLFHLKYQVLRVTQYHFTDQAAFGWIAWVFAALGVAFPRTRKSALLLLASATLWVMIVAGNGQVRWQNERYTMPAVAWFLLAASLGAGALFLRAFELRRRIRGPLLAAFGVAGIASFLWHQAPRFREQIWFFGRASRNVLEQHVRAGRLLRQLTPKPTRVLVGDAGAIPYASDLPALDIIGLGGFQGMPFARATRQHVGAAIELIERIPVAERPDVLAIYPGWWGDLPLWFGREFARVSVRGNVICGGASKVLYRADWSPLELSGQPFALNPGERLVDQVDQADIVNERDHRYHIDGIDRSPGYVNMKLLLHPKTQRPLWDAGRVVPPGSSETFELSGLTPGKPLRLVVRSAPTADVDFAVLFDDQPVGNIELKPRDGWLEAQLPAVRVDGPTARVRFAPSKSERVLHHVFVLQGP